MKFTPRLPENNVNVSKKHPLIELLWLTGGLVLIGAVVFTILGFVTDVAVSKTPVALENRLGNMVMANFPAEENQELSTLLDSLLESLPPDSSLRRYDFQVYISKTEEINAMALPGARIIVFSGLLNKVESENELTMILAHELAHFKHRDHLRGLGRGLGLVVITTGLFGIESPAADLVSNTFLSFQSDYSRDQEAAADEFGLLLLNRHYGHVGGGVDFFKRLAGKDSGSRVPYLLASHPHPMDRIAALEQVIAEHNLAIDATKTISAGIGEQR